MKNWIKDHPRQTIAIVAIGIIIVGVVMLLPKSPWTLIYGGLGLLAAVGISAIPSDL